MRQIDADDLKEAFDTTFFNDEDDYKRALRIIDNAPTVMNGKDYDLYLEGYKQGKKGLDRPKGKWIGDCYNPECDQCHTKPLEEFCDSLGLDGGSYVSIPMFFCPTCGADMRTKENTNG